MVGLLLIGVNASAQGDLIVNGKLGVGTDAPSASYKLDVSSTDLNGIIVTVNQIDGGNTANLAKITTSGSANLSSSRGTDSTVLVEGNHSTINNLVGGLYKVTLDSDTSGTTEITNNITALRATIADYIENAQDFNIANVYYLDIKSIYYGEDGVFAVTNQIGLSVPALTFPSTNTYGIKIAEQTSGTNNYGIVLDGNGAGSDIVFGPNQEARIYSAQETQDPDGVGIWVEDEAGNATQISPHDYKTGEWIFYSKNTKTGRTVRVDMERMVKAVEKLTGETFMIETLVDVE